MAFVLYRHLQRGFFFIWHQQQSISVAAGSSPHARVTMVKLNISKGRIDLQIKAMTVLGTMNIEYASSCTVVSGKGLTYCHSSPLIQKALCFQQCAGNYLVPVLCGCPQAPA